MDLVHIFNTYGPWGLVAFFVWRDWKKSQEMGAKLDEVRNFVQETLLSALSDSTTAIVENSNILKERPCLLTENEKRNRTKT